MSAFGSYVRITDTDVSTYASVYRVPDLVGCSIKGAESGVKLCHVARLVGSLHLKGKGANEDGTEEDGVPSEYSAKWLLVKADVGQSRETCLYTDEKTCESQ